MPFLSMLLLCLVTISEARHFNGGTITWAPVDPYDNSSSVDVTITQSYAWKYPVITCASNVPISTSGRSTQNTNLTCVTDCATDGGYSNAPINILTDCQTVSAALGMMSSQRSANVTLTADAHFYLAFVGSAWSTLNDPAQSGLQWSIVTFIDLRRRPDGFINTPPVAKVVSPQYAIVNRTIHIQIPVSDVNAGDDVRCRWSTYTPGYRRRRQVDDDAYFGNQYNSPTYRKPIDDTRVLYSREKRWGWGSGCNPDCATGDTCSRSQCQGTTCSGLTCGFSPCCVPITTVTTTTTTSGTTTTTTGTTSTTSRTTTMTTSTITTTSVSTTSTTTPSTTTIATTTIETQGTLQSTSSYPHRQAIDECGGICFPQSLPNGTTMANCTITFTGPIVNTWYGVAIQVIEF